jgi:hypothetical protein
MLIAAATLRYRILKAATLRYRILKAAARFTANGIL